MERSKSELRISNGTLATGTGAGDRLMSLAKFDEQRSMCAGQQVMSPSPLRVVAVSHEALRSKLLDSLLADQSPYDIAVLECPAGAYRRIRQLVPDLIVVLMRIDDEAGCHLLTMLAADRELSGIPVVTWVIGESEGDLEQLIGRPVFADDAVALA